MKKFLIILLFTFSLTGCSPTSAPQQPPSPSENISTSSSGSTEQNPVAVNTQTTTEQSAPPIQTESEMTKFVGKIGKAAIHAQFEIKDNNLSGVYYYDKYKKDIEIKGQEHYIPTARVTLKISEDADPQAEMVIVYMTEDLIEGFWQSGNVIHPMYLIREGSDIPPPAPPGEVALQYHGPWTAWESDYFRGGDLYFTAIFDNLSFCELTAHEGANSGSLETFVFPTTLDQWAVTIKEKQEVTFEFGLQEEEQIGLESNMYDYDCGHGVSFAKTYTRGKDVFPLPSALQCGIVETEEQDAQFRQLVGDQYGDIIQYTGNLGYQESTLDGRTIKTGYSMLRGYGVSTFFMLDGENISAACWDGFTMDFYTNDENYASKLPKPFEDWIEGEKWRWEAPKPVYHFKE